MQGDLIKFLIKVLDENTNRLTWEHLCYAPKDLYLKFLETLGVERFEMADFVSEWAKEDFNIDLPMTTAKDIAILRALVIDKYSSAYPHLLRKTETDRQGWLRVWVSSHMEKDLQRRRPS
jgi:hypothetical protein